MSRQPGTPYAKSRPLSTKCLMRGKKQSIEDSIKDGAEKVRRLAEEVDAVLTTFRPSMVEKYGISYRRLAETKPDLI